MSGVAQHNIHIQQTAGVAHECFDPAYKRTRRRIYNNGSNNSTPLPKIIVFTVSDRSVHAETVVCDDREKQTSRRRRWNADPEGRVPTRIMRCNLISVDENSAKHTAPLKLDQVRCSRKPSEMRLVEAGSAHVGTSIKCIGHIGSIIPSD